MKQAIKKTIELLHLRKKYSKEYALYYREKKKKIYSALEERGISGIKEAQRHEWKIWYDCTYYNGFISDCGKLMPVFIKVMGSTLEDCYQNELLVNQYIDEKSDYLRVRKPKIYFGLQVDELYIIVYSKVEMKPVAKNEKLYEDIQKVLDEYYRIGILHTDFHYANMCKSDNGMNMFFDYETSICPLSNGIRIRRNRTYNHVDDITKEARECIDFNPDYYYDDLVHVMGNDAINYDIRRNYIVGKGMYFIVSLSGKLYHFKIYKRSANSGVDILSRTSIKGELVSRPAKNENRVSR